MKYPSCTRNLQGKMIAYVDLPNKKQYTGCPKISGEKSNSKENVMDGTLADLIFYA